MKISFITTVFNEEENIEKLLDSLIKQTKLPDEIIIVDAFSSDKTVSKIKNFSDRFKKKGVDFELITKKGNRSVGRNEAIRNATGDLIACSDAGCVLDRDWLKNITQPFDKNDIDVVAGYYKGRAMNVFQKCLIPYVLVMPDKIDPDNFLPATRSVAFKKKIWKTLGGFPEQFSENEDYVFAKILKKTSAKIIFQKDAISYWIPRNNLLEVFIMFFRFAKGDMEARILRPKVAFIFVRYLAGIALLFYFFILKSFFILYSLYIILVMYLLWAVVKNYRYIKDIRAFVILPILQITADFAVMIGTIFGLYNIWDTKKM